MELSLHRILTWAWPIAFVLGGLLAGILVDRFLQNLLGRLTRRTDWAWDDTATAVLKRAPIFWLTAAGAYLAVTSLELSEEIAGLLQKGLVALILFSVTLVAARLTGTLVRGVARRKAGGIPSTSLITNIARVLVFVLGVIIILGQLGVEITPLITGLGIGGLAVALALQDTLSNLFSGFQIILTRQVVRGDFIRLESGEEGYVTDVQWRNTTIKSRLDDTETVVPNRKLADSIVTNYSLPGHPLWLRVPVGVHYSSDLPAVERVTIEVGKEVLRETVGLEEDGPDWRDPVVRFQAFGDSSVDLNVRLWVSEYAEQFLVRHEFVKRLHARYREEGIVIPFPIRTVEFATPLRTEREGAAGQGAAGEGAGGQPSGAATEAPERPDAGSEPSS